jgi:hypothetical protein
MPKAAPKAIQPPAHQHVKPPPFGIRYEGI